MLERVAALAATHPDLAGRADLRLPLHDPSGASGADVGVTVTVDGAALLSWADGAGGDLPWRRTRDPWAVLVAS